MPYPGIERLDVPGVEITDTQAAGDGVIVSFTRAGQRSSVRVPHPTRGFVSDAWLAQVRAAIEAT